MITNKIDVTKEHCPMTFVKAKVALSKLQMGDRLEVLLTEGEPLENVPRSAIEGGYSVIEISHVINNIHRVIIEKQQQ
jgi:TusA-related sulfurtransferase